MVNPSTSLVQVIKPGRLIDGTGGAPVEGAAVVIKEGIVSWVGHPGSPDEPPELAEAVANGHLLEFPDTTLLPGLIDCHVHTNMPGDGRTGEDVDRDTDDRRLLRSARNAHLALVSGVTTLCDCGSWNRTAFSLKEGIDLGLVSGPRVLVSGPPITITGGHLWYMGGEVDGVDAVRRQVRWLIKAGADIIKVVASGGSTLTSDPYRPSFDLEEIKTVTEEAHNRGRPVAAHCRSTVSINKALESKVDVILHCSFYDPDGSYRFDQPTAERLADSGVWVNPTHALGLLGRAQLRRKREHEALTAEDDAMLIRMEDGEERRKEQFGRLTEIGVKLVGGSDSGWSYLPFGDFQSEVMSMTDFGLSPMQSILTGTRDAAEALGILSSVGTIEAGKVADLLLVDGNPAEDIARLRSVVAVFQAGCLVESGYIPNRDRPEV